MKLGVLIFGILFLIVGFFIYNSIPKDASFECNSLQENGYLSLLNPDIDQGCKNLRLEYFGFGLMGMGALIVVFGLVLGGER